MGTEQSGPTVKVSELKGVADAMKENGIIRLRVDNFELELAPQEVAKAAQERMKAQLTPEQIKEFEEKTENRKPRNMAYWSSGGPVSK